MAKFSRKDGISLFRFTRKEIIDAVGEERAKILLKDRDDLEEIAFRMASDEDEISREEK